MANTYRISFRLADASFEIESTDKTWLHSKEKEYLEKLSPSPQHTRKVAAIPPENRTSPAVSGATINEFFKKYIKSYNLSRADISVFFIYYLQRIRKTDSIKTADVKQCFADVGFPKYNNLNIADILNQAKRKALLNYVNDFWSLTITGEDFVLNLMSGAPQ